MSTFAGMSADLPPPDPAVVALLAEFRTALCNGETERAERVRAELDALGWPRPRNDRGWFAYARIGSRSIEDLGGTDGPPTARP